MYNYPYTYSGLGDAQTHDIIATSINTGATVGVLSYIALADPEPITKAILGIGVALTALFSNMFRGCGQTCVAATHIVDQVEAEYLKPLLATYMDSDRSYATQQAALSVFDQAWQLVQQGCSDPALGDAGKRCISDRQRGGKWDWFRMYRDPIANDPNASMVGPQSPLSSGNYGWLLPVALIIVGVML